jgi:hypothetical protein
MSRKLSSFFVGIIAGAAATLMLPSILKKLEEETQSLKPAKKSAPAKPARTPAKRKLIARTDTTTASAKKTKTK